MGNSNSCQMNQEALFTEDNNQTDLKNTQQFELVQKSPLHLYTLYKTPMNVKTLSSLLQKGMPQNNLIFIEGRKENLQLINLKNLSHLSPNEQKRKSIKIDKQISIKSMNNKGCKQNTFQAIQKVSKSKFKLQSHRQKSQKQDPLIKNPPRKSSIFSKQRQAQFKSIVINIQNFIQINEKPIDNYYQFLQVLGEGAYGQVYKGVCKLTGEYRAIKKIKVKNMGENKQKLFLSQMNLLSKLHHPSIIILYEVFFNENNYFVVMQYCKGGAVADMLEKYNSKSQKQIAIIIKQVLSALSYMHSLNIVHRDIKLDNIVFLHPIKNNNRKSDDQEQSPHIPIKIIDFGSAVQHDGKEIHQYSVAGTLSYLAPQAMRGILSNKSDVWSCGVLMAILLTGKSPFKGSNQNQTRTNINTKIIKYDDPPFRYLSPEAKNLMSLMLQKDFKKRITANQALKHPWFNSKRRDSVNAVDLKQLQTYERGNNLISMIESYISIKKVTQQQKEKLGKIFNDIDKDGNGMIDVSELIQCYTQNAFSYNKQQLIDIVNSIDMNKSGKIDFNEFIIIMEGRKKLFISDHLSDAFDYFDRQKKHYLERSQIIQILKGGDLAEVDYLIEQLDKNGDNRITKQQFINYLMLC